MVSAGRVALVTGGGRGIGAAIAAALAKEGARVVVMGRNEADLARVAAGIEAQAGLALAIPGDVTIPADVDRVILATRFKLGAIDILVNNAGMADSAPLKRTEDALWDAHIALNLTAAFHLARSTAPGMAERGWGRIINIASVAARTGFPYTAAYSASKAGLIGLTRALAAELGPRGVTVNAVCPGWTETELLERSVERIVATTGRKPDEVREKLAADNPARRFVTPAEVASVVAYLATDAACSVNGQAWNVDGGGSMR